jgi:hypothetical protein
MKFVASVVFQIAETGHTIEQIGVRFAGQPIELPNIDKVVKLPVHVATHLEEKGMTSDRSHDMPS